MSTLEDTLALKDLMARYVDAVNHYDADSWIATWAEDGVWTLMGMPVSGRDNILAFWHEMMKAFGAVIMLPNSGTFEIDGDSATGHYYLHEYTQDKEGNGSVVLSRYQDSYCKRDGRWFYQTREHTMMYNGPTDLSGSFTPLGDR